MNHLINRLSLLFEKLSLILRPPCQSELTTLIFSYGVYTLRLGGLHINILHLIIQLYFSIVIIITYKVYSFDEIGGLQGRVG